MAGAETGAEMAFADSASAASAASAASVFDSSAGVARGALTSPLWLNLLGTVLALSLVLALAWLVLRGAQRWAQRSPRTGAASPRVLRSIALGGRERLVVVQHHDVELLLGVSAAGITLLERRRVDVEDAEKTDETTAAGTLGTASR